MSVNIKQNGDLVRVANNISIVQANWNDRDNTSKSTCIKNQPATLKTLDEISANTDENALAGASVIKELIETGAAGGGCNIVYLTKAEYEALPESKLTDDVEYRITDANTANKIAATDVTYGDTTVEGAINEVAESLESFGYNQLNIIAKEKVDLSTYSADNPYTTPCIGFARINGTGSVLGIFNNSGVYEYGTILTSATSLNSLFLPKGFKIYGTTSGNGTVEFLKLRDV